MLFAIGTKVRLKHTGDHGEVTEMLADGMLNVWIPAQEMEIPVFEDDLVREQDFKAAPKKNKKPAPVATPPVEKIVQYAPPATTDNYTTFKSQGLQLAFDPKYDIEGLTTHYQVFLLNDSTAEFLFSSQRTLPNQSAKKTHGKLTAHSTYQLEDVLFDQLNDTPIYEIECWEITTAGTGNKQQKTLKVKAKQFFKKVKIAPLLDRAVHLYVLFDRVIPKKKEKEDDLKSYTQKNVRPVQYQKTGNQNYNVHDVKEYANFTGEIDLHIENLPSRKGKMSSGEKLQLQLDHFEKYVDKAIRLGVPRIYVIHGIGKGKLKNMIASRLIQMPEVKTFKNEYHPRYGWGATEVIF